MKLMSWIAAGLVVVAGLAMTDGNADGALVAAVCAVAVAILSLHDRG